MKLPHYLIVYLLLIFSFSNLFAQRGYYDAPYKRYEAENGLEGSTATIYPKSYNQADLQSEASDQQCVLLTGNAPFVSWQLQEPADGMVLRYSVPDGTNATVGVYEGSTLLTVLTLTSTWSWESLWNNGNSNNVGVVNHNPKMRFDEVRFKLPSLVSGTLKLVQLSGQVTIDFIEMEAVPAIVPLPIGAVTYLGDGSTLQTFINSHGGQTIYLPAGVYNVNSQLYFGVTNTSLVGAGMWYTQIHFTSTTQYNGGLNANAANVSYSNLYLTTVNTSRSNSYKAINGVYTAGATITNVWAEHFECGAWIAQYNSGGPAIADGFTMAHCRFRNNYADGINLCKGTSNAIVEHCNFRNNGDDDQAIWCANGLECINNTFRNNTSENCWRASGVAFYGGKNNKAYNLIIKDNLESGIRLSNNFSGVGFNTLGLNELHDITIIGSGTLNDLYNQKVGAIDIFSSNSAGTQVRNIQFTNIDIIDSKCDAILIQKKAGDGIYNLAFENINCNSTGKEYPFNNTNNVSSPKGFFTSFNNFPNGNATYCNMNYSNRGGTATTDESTLGLGTFSWSQLTGCVLLGTAETKEESLLIYPNPANNQVTIHNQSAESQLIIYDSSGKLVMQYAMSTEKNTIDISALPKGLYLMVLKNEKTIRTSKLIKQ
jgi:hypothetical protein